MPKWFSIFLLNLNTVARTIPFFCCTILMILYHGILPAQELKQFAGHSYPVYGNPVAELQDKFFSPDGTDGWLKCYTLIQGDSLFVTDELFDSHHELWKVLHGRVLIDSLEQLSVALFWDSLQVKGKLQKIYSMKLRGKGNGGILMNIGKDESFIHFFTSIGVFFEDKETSYRFFDDLR